MTNTPPDETRREEPCQIVIGRDGRIAFQVLTEDMLELARALAPHDQRLNARAATGPARKRGADDAGSDPGD